MKIKTKAVLTVVILLCAGAYRVYCMNKPDDTPEYVNHYDEVYDVLQDEEKNEKYTTNMSGIYNEYGIEDMFGDDYIAERKDVRKALKDKGLTKYEIENAEWYAWMSDEEMISHDSAYRENLKENEQAKEIAVYVLLFFLLLGILLI